MRGPFKIAFSGLTMGYAKGAAQEERVRSSARVIVLFLKSWPGEKTRTIFSASRRPAKIEAF